MNITARIRHLVQICGIQWEALFYLSTAGVQVIYSYVFDWHSQVVILLVLFVADSAGALGQQRQLQNM